MYYYDPDNRNPRRWAVIALAVYASALVAAFWFVSFDFSRIVEKPNDTIEIEFIEPEPPKPVDSSVRRVHEHTTSEEQVAQVDGSSETTRTPNPKALFKMNRGGADEPENAGNPHAREGENSASGRGSGLDPDGSEQLDKGLQGRGLVGNLPRPAYPGTESGKVVVRVTVGPRGEVESAVFEPRGSTINDKALIDAAIAAARKARFAESAATVQGGTITYIFRMK